MKTDLKALLNTLETGSETLAEDAAEIVLADPPAFDALRQRGLIGHAITGLRGVAENIKGLLIDPPQ